MQQMISNVPQAYFPITKTVNRFDLPPKITISITETCPLRCKHCYADCNSGRESAQLTLKEWKKFIDYLISNGVIQIYIEGGEPFSRPDFIEILEYCCPRVMVLVRTHGAGVDVYQARQLRKIGVGRVFVDVMGSTATTHDAHTGVPGSFDQTCSAAQ